MQSGSRRPVVIVERPRAAERNLAAGRHYAARHDLPTLMEPAGMATYGAMQTGTNDAMKTDAERQAAAEAEAKLLADLTPDERDLVERVRNHHPALTVSKALDHLRASGM